MEQSRDRVAAGGDNMGSTGTSGSAGTSGENSGIAQTIRSTAVRQLDGQKARASDTIGSVAGAVRGMTQPLRDNGQESIANYVNKAADGLERWASDFRQQDIEDAMRAVQRFARRQPAVFLGIAFTAGVVAARFLKSSADDEYSSQRYTMPRTSPRPTGTSDFAAAPFGTTSGDIPRISPDVRSTGEVI